MTRENDFAQRPDIMTSVSPRRHAARRDLAGPLAAQAGGAHQPPHHICCRKLLIFDDEREPLWRYGISGPGESTSRTYPGYGRDG